MGWRPIDTAPKDGVTIVDLWRGDERLPNYIWFPSMKGKGKGFFTNTKGGYYCVMDATHWMPVPAPPTE